MARARTQQKSRPKRPLRPPRKGAPLTVFDLGREHRLAPLVVCDPSTSAHYKEADPLTDVRAKIAASKDDYVVELAWDGHRVLVCTVDENARFVSSDFRDWAELFPTITRALYRLKKKDLVLEGWLCALGERGLPSFELLRLHAQKEPQRVLLACTDLLRVDGVDLRPLPLVERRRRLAEMINAAREDALVVSESLTAGSLDAILEGVRRVGGRGVTVRASHTPYPSFKQVASPKNATLHLHHDGPTAPDAASTPWLAVGCRPEEEIELDRALSPPPKVTNQDKLMYPRDGITKSDVAAYYDDVAPILLAYMKDRPMVGQRWPDGIDEFTWYQHRMPPKAPDYLRAVWIDGNRRIVVENRDALLWLANQAVLTFHGWASRCASLESPDWVVIDLDPGESTTWAQLIEVAIGLRKLLELLELPSVPKTSGQKGLHVLIPIGPKHNVAMAHELARRAAKMLCQVLPTLVTTESSIADRHGRLYLDTLQNFVGKTLVLPYSLRAADGAPVSTPLSWSEVTPKLDPRAFTLKTMRRRLDAVGDVAKPLLAGTTRLAEIIARMPP